jgi:hypothetical protein
MKECVAGAVHTPYRRGYPAVGMLLKANNLLGEDHVEESFDFG